MSENEVIEKANNPKSLLLGFFVGLAIIIPGFSGAQLAILFKMYDKLVSALGKLFSKKSILFLLPIVIGAVIGFLLGLFSVRFLLEISLFAVVAFFAGLMLGGIRSITDEVKGQKFKKNYIINILIGLAIPLGLSLTAIFSNFNLGEMLKQIPWYMYLMTIVIGILVALTQLIPGLSATALLMSIGLYDVLLKSISVTYWQENPKILLIYGCLVLGALVGVIFISKFINRMLNQYKTGFYYIIIGLCISSIISMFVNPEMMAFYKNYAGNDYLHILVGVFLFIAGSIGVYFTYLKTRKQDLDLNMGSHL